MHFWVPDFMVGTAEAFIVGQQVCVVLSTRIQWMLINVQAWRAAPTMK